MKKIRKKRNNNKLYLTLDTYIDVTIIGIDSVIERKKTELTDELSCEALVLGKSLPQTSLFGPISRNSVK